MISPAKSLSLYTRGFRHSRTQWILNISSLHFSLYSFSKVPFALLTRTRSSTWYLAFRPCFLSLFHRRAIFSRGVCVFSRHNRRLHSGGRMSRMIVSTHDILQNINIAPCIFMNKIAPYSLFQRSVEAKISTIALQHDECRWCMGSGFDRTPEYQKNNRRCNVIHHRHSSRCNAIVEIFSARDDAAYMRLVIRVNERSRYEKFDLAARIRLSTAE